MKSHKQKSRSSSNASAGFAAILAGIFKPAQWLWLSRLTLRAAILTLLAAAVGFAFNYMEKQVQDITHDRQVSLSVRLANSPPWLPNNLYRNICYSAGIRADDPLLDETLTPIWFANLRSNPWIKTVNKIHKHYDGMVEIDCQIREPIASVKKDGKLFYVDLEGVLLPGDPVNKHLVRLRGGDGPLPESGEAITSPQLIAGIKVLQLIRHVDERLPPQDRLWTELASLDVANFEGQIDPTQSHLTLYTKGQTPVHWGAPVGKSLAYYEAEERIKLDTLYRQFKHTGSLDRYQYIELRNQRKEKADPLKPRQNG